ncbi:MAG TPA: transglutaminase-like domain-containing protein, partial [Labilithrix sp.]
MRHAWILLVPIVVLAAAPADAQRPGPVLHEVIPPDPREDVALSVPLDGELHAAIDTPRGPIAAPDPNKPPQAQGEAPYSNSPRDGIPDSTFDPDRHTQRPDVLPYDDPFSPSTAPFKRLSAFDRVDASYTLSVRDPSTRPLAISASPPPDPSEEKFYADMVVDLGAGQHVKIPSVGPDARVLAARAGVGTQDVRFRLYRDGADNWFIESEVSTRARVVMELAIRRAAFGGDFGNPSWAEMLPVPPLPPKVTRSATEVAARIGVSRRMSPRDVVAKLVSYFRGFSESDEPPAQTTDIYLDLALSKKGVCRHRAFAFLVTALYLGLPTRMIVNEAHAWVEVYDGHMWRRIDLGG